MPGTTAVTIPLSVADPDAATDLMVTASGLPPGWVVTPSTTAYGIGWQLAISGTPNVPGTFNVTVSACDWGSVRIR